MAGVGVVDTAIRSIVQQNARAPLIIGTIITGLQENGKEITSSLMELADH